MGDLGLIPELGRCPGEGNGYPLQSSWASPVAQLVKNPPAMWETWVRFLGWEDPLVLQVHRVAESDTTESLSLSLYFHFSCSVVSDSVTSLDYTHQAPLSMEFSKEEYLSE